MEQGFSRSKFSSLLVSRRPGLFSYAAPYVLERGVDATNDRIEDLKQWVAIGDLFGPLSHERKTEHLVEIGQLEKVLELIRTGRM